MPWGLRRYQKSGALHFITFSCYRRHPLLRSHLAADLFEQALEQARLKYNFYVLAYVVMPEHVHLLVTEPEHATLATAIKAIKQSVARRVLKVGNASRSSQQKDPLNQNRVEWGTRSDHFWQARYYNFNVTSSEKRIEKIRYIHHNPVKRGLVELPEQWTWSSYRHYAKGELGTVQIESPMSVWKRRQAGSEPKLVVPPS
jgi:putative transposase